MPRTPFIQLTIRAPIEANSSAATRKLPSTKTHARRSERSVTQSPRRRGEDRRGTERPSAVGVLRGLSTLHPLFRCILCTLTADFFSDFGHRADWGESRRGRGQVYRGSAAVF